MLLDILPCIRPTADPAKTPSNILHALEKSIRVLCAMKIVPAEMQLAIEWLPRLPGRDVRVLVAFCIELVKNSDVKPDISACLSALKGVYMRNMSRLSTPGLLQILTNTTSNNVSVNL